MYFLVQVQEILLHLTKKGKAHCLYSGKAGKFSSLIEYLTSQVKSYTVLSVPEISLHLLPSDAREIVYV